MSVKKPTFAGAVEVIERYPTMNRAEDVAFVDSLRLIEECHVSPEGDADRNGHYGVCAGCGDPWPCPVWVNAERLVVEWVIAAAAEVWADAQEVRRRQRVGEEPKECVGYARGWPSHNEGCRAVTAPTEEVRGRV